MNKYKLDQIPVKSLQKSKDRNQQSPVTERTSVAACFSGEPVKFIIFIPNSQVNE